QHAIARADMQLAEAKYKATKDLEWSLLQEQPRFWMALFEYLCEAVLKGPHAAEARIPIDEGKAAINRNDIGGLVQACRQLIQLLPEGQESALPAVVLSHIA